MSREVLLKGIETKAILKKDWLLSTFSVSRTETPTNPYPGQLDSNEKEYRMYLDNQWVTIPNTDTTKPLLRMRGKVSLKKDDLPNLQSDIETTYGRAILNYLVLARPFGNRVPYMNQEIKPAQIERIISENLVDDDAESIKPNQVRVSEYIRCAEAAFFLAGLTQICVYSATQKSMTTNPEIRKRRAELIKQAGESISDPVVQAKIEAELVKMDREWIKGDPSEGFYLKDKSFVSTRKTMYISQGAPTGFDQKGNFIENSLQEGWDVKALPGMSNSMREGSYARGSLTALGGETTKYTVRIFQNAGIVEEDCGSTQGLPITLTNKEAHHYIGSTALFQGKSILLTDENINEYIGKPIRLRSAGYCWTHSANFCLKCIGQRYADTPNALGIGAAEVGSKFLSASLARFHANVKQLVEFNISSIIS